MQGIKQLGIFFGPIFLLFSYESRQGPCSLHYLAEILRPRLLMTALERCKNYFSHNLYHSLSLNHE